MKRRELFGASLAGASLWGSACATPTATRDPTAASYERDREALDAVARVDGALALLDLPVALPMMFRDVQPLAAGGSGGDLVRGVLRTSLIVAFFRDLPEAARLHSEVQRRMWQAVPTMRATLEGAAQRLRSLTKRDLDGIARVLRADPGLPGRVCAALDAAPGSQTALSRRRRAQLRAMAAELTFRLQHQPAQLAIDELVGKFERSRAMESPPDPRIEAMIQAASSPQEWSVVAAALDEIPAQRQEDDQRAGPDDEPWLGAAEWLALAGAALGLGILGLGIAVGVGSIFGVVSTPGISPFVFGVTAGVLLCLLALIVIAAVGMTYAVLGHEDSIGQRPARGARFEDRVQRELEATRREIERARAEADKEPEGKPKGAEP